MLLDVCQQLDTLSQNQLGLIVARGCQILQPSTNSVVVGIGYMYGKCKILPGFHSCAGNP